MHPARYAPAVGVDRLIIFEPAATGRRLMCAREQSRDGDLFTYDVDVIGADGRCLEEWRGLRLRVVGEAAPSHEWIAELLGPYVERRAAELIPGSEMAVVVDRPALDPDRDGERRARSDRVIQRLLWAGAEIQRRPDGKTEIVGPSAAGVSAAHAGDLTVAVAGRGPVGCDISRCRSGRQPSGPTCWGRTGGRSPRRPPARAARTPMPRRPGYGPLASV